MKTKYRYEGKMNNVQVPGVGGKWHFGEIKTVNEAEARILAENDFFKKPKSTDKDVRKRDGKTKKFVKED